MSAAAIDALDRVTGALTYDAIQQIDCASGETLAEGETVPLLQRSIAQDLRELEGRLGLNARGQTLLSAIANSIDEAILAAAEAKTELGKGAA